MLLNETMNYFVAPIAGLVFAATTSMFLPTAALAQAGGLCPAQVSSRLTSIVKRNGNVSWSILAQTQGAPGDRVNLYNWNAQTQLIPASNNKVLTTAAALQALGPQYRMKTVVTGSNAGSNLATLRIIGQGDPTLKTIHLNTLAQQVRQRGVQQVNLLIGDDTYFRGADFHPSWAADDTVAGYGAPVNSLMLNQNAIELTLFPQRVGQPLRVQWNDPTDAQDWRLSNRSVTVSPSSGESVDVYRDRTARIVYVEGQLRAGSASELAAASISNPGNYLIQKFRNALTAAQINVANATVVKTSPAPPGEIELASWQSPPLAELLKETNQESNNVFAETLLKSVGKAQNPNNTDGFLSGAAAVKSVLAPLGVNPNRYSMVDGSGLSRRNRASAEAFVQTLQGMAQSPNAQAYRNSLAIAGTSGTLKSRFRNTAVQGRFAGKTGTLTGATSLSGYLNPPNYSPVVVSILANYSNASVTTVRSAMDDMVLTLAQLRSCQ